jgi:hypothetical protein
MVVVAAGMGALGGGSAPVSELVDVAAGICALGGGNHLLSRDIISEIYVRSELKTGTGKGKQ